MQGVDRITGKSLTGIKHIEQSVRDILTTRKGTRVMNRDYGSDLPLLIDNPLNQRTLGLLRAETVDALAKWEPRLRCDEVKVANVGAGFATLNLVFTFLVDGSVLTINDLRIGGDL